MFFAMFIIGGVTLFILDIFFRPIIGDGTGGSGIFENMTYSSNATIKMSEGIYNIFEQMPNVGKLAGVSLIVGVMGLLGVGGYLGYKQMRGM